jgi:hypothetical protein
LVRSKFEWVSVAWSSATITNSNKLQSIQRKFAALCYNRFFQNTEYHHVNLMEILNLLIFRNRRRLFDAFFFKKSLVILNIALLSSKL